MASVSLLLMTWPGEGVGNLGLNDAAGKGQAVRTHDCYTAQPARTAALLSPGPLLRLRLQCRWGVSRHEAVMRTLAGGRKRGLV